ncbi:MAG: M81 family metallopeptidase [Gammaproteobacteria bacterium]|nr:MAG: M81 family peptidase [Gammaproteobacteria bacterium]UCH41491.1 MAG: M81 family metallopeptidase [Gammaproteobacteria bacterium]
MSTQKTIAIGGFQHETNTFAPHRAAFDAFERADSWPGLTRGAALFDVMPGLNIPLAGFIASAQTNGHELLPLCWCSAEPSSYVTEDAFERVARIICDSLSAADRLDAVYLDLHGAMVCEHGEDGEGMILQRVRDVVGDDIPIVISLDLHANLTRAMLGLSDAMAIYRTYPHLDMAATGARAYDLLENIWAQEKLHKSMLKIPFLIPLPSQCTDFEPCRSIYRELQDLSGRPGVASVDFAAGFPPSDIAECGAAVVAYGEDAAATEAAAEDLYLRIVDAEAEFHAELLEADAAVERAMQNASDKPVVLADAQDNPGAGATSDTTGLLEALVRCGARQAVLAILYDPEVADQAHAAGIGAEIDAALGAKMGFPGVEAYSGRFEVEALGDGRFVFTGEMNRNSHAELGNMALLRVVDDAADVRVVVGSTRAQCLDLAIIRHLGIEPAEQKIVAVKSTVHFRADFDPIAAETLVVRSPGANYCKLTDMKYRNLRAGVRLEPLGPVHTS